MKTLCGLSWMNPRTGSFHDLYYNILDLLARQTYDIKTDLMSCVTCSEVVFELLWILCTCEHLLSKDNTFIQLAD